MERGNS